MEVMEAAGNGDSAYRTYEAYAPVYDLFTAHYEHDEWLADLLAAAQRHGLAGKRLLDVACGTGKSFLAMLPRGWQVTGCDISPSMLELAAAKVGEDVRLELADMRELPVFGEFDLVWCLDDALNYLLGEDELGRALVGMRANLGPGGLLVFDVNALHAYRTAFAETDAIERGGHRLVWRGRTPSDVAPGSICEARLEVTAIEADAEAAGATHTHRQRHFPEAVVLAALGAAGLECLDVYGHGFDGIFKQPLDESVHTKAIYVARPAAG
jgi:SAM-dependent methyltransferase